jgi:RimJ/RimL family protein N-acetyltransferase
MNILETDRIYLRILTISDVTQKYCDWLNDNEVTKYLETHYMTIDKLYEYVSKNIDNKNCILFGIFDTKNNEHIGNIKLEPINYSEGYTELGIMIGNKNYWGKNIGYDSIKLMMKYCFNILKLNEIQLGVHVENKRAIKLYQKLGFIEYNVIENTYIRMKIINI